MTIKDCIDIVDNIKPNQYTIREKVMWLSFVDETIINDVLKTHEGYDGRYDNFEGYTEDKLSVTLIVPSPYDRLYKAYLKMKIDQENGETTRYNNSAALYNSYLMEFRRYYHKTHMPIDATNQRPMIPQKHTVGLSDAEYENLKKDLTYILTEHFSSTISHDKVYAVVNEFVQNNIHLLKISPEEIKSALLEYLEKNPIKVDVPDWAKQPSKPTYTADEVGAYTKEETVNAFLSKGDFILEKANLATVDMLNNAFREVNESVSKKLEGTILYEDVVNTPVWTKQPTYEGALDSAFNTTDFYYVTLEDASGNALPSGQFMLKEFYTDGATVYSTVFTLANLNTGSETLIENYPVEFTQIGATVKMRDAGVWEVAYNPSEWKLNGNYGSLSFVCDGQFIQRVSSAYFISQFQTDKNVSHYHSVNTTAYQTDSDSRNMGIYIALNDGKAYKTNKFYNEFTITRISDTRYKTQRTATLRYINFADGTPKVISGNEFGHGEIQQGDAFLKKMNVQVAAVASRGFIRNGTVIRVTEVK